MLPISFGVPAALVNCISTDAQLWHRQVRFATEAIILQNGCAVAQTELTQSPWRWRVSMQACWHGTAATLVDKHRRRDFGDREGSHGARTGKTDDYAAALVRLMTCIRDGRKV